MIPVGDRVRSHTFPYVNVLLMSLNISIFVYYAFLLTDLEVSRLFLRWGVIPVELIGWLKEPIVWDGQEILTPVTSMFLHGGWLHLASNMVFLWVFGDNVEDALGHLRYVVFYLLGGVSAVVLHVALNQHSFTPTIGASGAVAAVLGGYLLLYPRAKISVLVLPLWFFGVLSVPSLVVIGVWFLLQLFSGVASIGVSADISSGIAYWAHVGGFVAGAVLIILFRPRRRSTLFR